MSESASQLMVFVCDSCGYARVAWSHSQRSAECINHHPLREVKYVLRPQLAEREAEVKPEAYLLDGELLTPIAAAPFAKEVLVPLYRHPPAVGDALAACLHTFVIERPAGPGESHLVCIDCGASSRLRHTATGGTSNV